MNWATVATICGAAIAGVAGASAFMAWMIRSVVKDELRKFAVWLNGTYWRTEMAKAEVRRVDERITETQSYARERCHQISNDLMSVMMKKG